MFGFLKKKKEEFVSPMTGKLITIEGVPDPAFSGKMMGDGFAVELTDGKVYAPISGTLSAVFPTGHAYGISTEDGIEVLVHIGMDTVQLEGKGFQCKVTQGDKVKQGDLLVEVDLDYIKSQDKPVVSPVVFTSGQKIEVLKPDTQVTSGEQGIIRIS